MLLTATSEFFFVLVVQSYSISLVRLQRILEKAFVPSVLVRSLLITSVFDNLEYEKKNDCFGKHLELWIQNLYEPCY